MHNGRKSRETGMRSMSFSHGSTALPGGLVIAVCGLVATACADAGDRSDADRGAAPAVVEIIARGLTFEGPDSTSAGWTTIRLRNETEMVHFAFVARYPEGRGVADQQEVLAPIFQEGMDLLNAGDPDAAMAKFGELPEWFGEVVFLGGPGLIAAGGTADATAYLEPGTYVIECYVKTGGVFHSVSPGPDQLGMVHELTVTADESEAVPPEPTVALTISSEAGIVVDDAAGATGNGEVDPPVALAAGDHIVSVRFEDQTTHENFLGHDVHVARLTEGTDLDALAAWMDWRTPEGLETPAPVEFAGGIHEMPAGETGYFSVTLEPGLYVWIAEVPEPASKGMLRTFIVE